MEHWVYKLFSDIKKIFKDPIKAAHKFQKSKEVTVLNDDSKPVNFSNEYKVTWVQDKILYKLKYNKYIIAHETGSCYGKQVGQNC